MIVPFTYDSVDEELIHKKLVVSRNILGSNTFKVVAEVSLDDGGEAEGAEEWSVDSGALRIDMGPEGGFYEFRGIESKNGVVYAVGTHSAEVGGRVRFTMHERVQVDTDFGICISSHVNYEKETLPVVLKSLRKAGFDSDRVMAVIGGHKDRQDGEESDIEGVKTIKRKASAMGFTALGDADSKHKYWMLLHDTCTVDRDFQEKASEIDIGMNPDVVLFSGIGDGVELGLYSSEYLSHGIVELDERVDSMLKGITKDASIVVECISEAESEGERDVYGSGIMRKVMTMKSIGVRKNVRRVSKKRP